MSAAVLAGARRCEASPTHTSLHGHVQEVSLVDVCCRVHGHRQLQRWHVSTRSKSKVTEFGSLPHFAPRVIVAKDGLTAKHSIQGKQAKEARMQALYTAPKRPLEGDNPWIMTYAMALAPYTPGAKATKIALADSLMVSMEMRPPLIITTAVGLPT